MNPVDIDKLTQGNKKAWDLFVEQISPLLLHIIKKTLLHYNQSTDDISDFLQDIFIHFYKDNFHVLKLYDPQHSQFSTWCGVIARNKVIDRLRKKSISTIPLDDEHKKQPVVVPVNPSEKIEIPLELLSNRQRLVIRLIYEKDMDVSDVADMLSISPQTVRSLRHKALTKLREHFNLSDKK